MSCVEPILECGTRAERLRHGRQILGDVVSLVWAKFAFFSEHVGNRSGFENAWLIRSGFTDISDGPKAARMGYDLTPGGLHATAIGAAEMCAIAVFIELAKNFGLVPASGCPKKRDSDQELFDWLRTPSQPYESHHADFQLSFDSVYHFG